MKSIVLPFNFNQMLKAACPILLLLAASAACGAKTLTWTGNASLYNQWSQPDNWSPSGPPANGDTLIFPANFTPVNDINNLQVHSIQFTGNGSTYLSGNPIVVESDITAASNNGEARVSFDITFSSGGGTFYTLGSSILNIEDNVYLGNNLALNLYAFTTNILVQGSIQGAADLVKLGSGDAYLLGTLANYYTGGTYIRGGRLHLSKSANVIAISPKLSVGESTSVTGSIADENPGQYPATMDVTIGPYGRWVLNGQTSVTNLSLSSSGPQGASYFIGISGTGILILNCDVYSTGTNASTIGCTLYLGNQTRTFNVDYNDWLNGYLAVASIVGTGTAGITKAGGGALLLTSPNDYAGPTFVQQGLLSVQNNTALGGSAGANSGTIVNDYAAIEFDSVTISEPLALGTQSLIRYAGTNTLTGSVTLNGLCLLTAWHHGLSGGDLLQVNSSIGGLGPLYVGGGYVRLGGPTPNTFTGGTVVGQDTYGIGFPITLELAKPDNVTALPGQVDVNNFYGPSSSATILRNLQDNGVFDVRLGHAAQWLLNGRVAAPHSLTFYNDGLVDSQGGQLQMTASPGTNRFYATATNSLNYTAQILGTLAMLAPTDEFNVDFGPTLQISALITGPGALQKTGPGALMIAGNDFNNYAGETFVNGGTLLLNKPLAATAIPGAVEVGAADGSSAGVLRNLNSYQIVGGIYVHSLGLYDVNGQVENTDYLTLDGNATVQTGAGYLSLKTGAGITVNPGVDTTATINDNVFLDPGNHVFTVGSGASAPGVQDFVINAAIGESAPTASIQKEGPGQMRLSGNSTYTGATYINHGKVFPTGAGAFGATNGPTYVTNDASLVLDGGVTIPGEQLFLNSTAPAALASRTGSNTWSGPVTIGGNSYIGVTNALNIFGIIDGGGNLFKVGAGMLLLDGLYANSYSGDTFVNEGTLAMKKIQLGTYSVPHNVTVGTGPSGPQATLLNLNENTIGGRVTMNDGGTWNLNNWSSAFQSDAYLGGPVLTLNGSANVLTGGIDFFNSSTIVVNPGNHTTATISADLFFVYADTYRISVSAGVNQTGQPECIVSGPISQLIPPSNLIKDGTGTLRLTGTNTYTGNTLVNAGTLWVDGVQPQSTVLLGAGRLGGYGTVGDIVMNNSSIVSPGEGPGILTCSNFNLNGTGSRTFQVELNGSAPGTGYDQVNARGTVTLSGISLNASLNFASTVNEQFTIINNDGADAVVGTFTGLPEGKKLYIGKELFQISYVGGSGNDVVLARLTTPPPPTLTLQKVPPAAVRLLWATNDPPFSLQTSTNFVNWAAASPLPTVIGATNVVTNSVAGPQQFYRLSSP